MNDQRTGAEVRALVTATRGPTCVDLAARMCGRAAPVFEFAALPGLCVCVHVCAHKAARSNIPSALIPFLCAETLLPEHHGDLGVCLHRDLHLDSSHWVRCSRTLLTSREFMSVLTMTDACYALAQISLCALV